MPKLSQSSTDGLVLNVYASCIKVQSFYKRQTKH